MVEDGDTVTIKDW